MEYVNIPSKYPDFLRKSTMGVSIISIFLVAPFALNHIFVGRMLLGLFGLSIILLCATTAWFCYHGRYYRAISVYGLTPMITATIALAIYTQGAPAAYWVFAGVLSLYFILPEKFAWIANAIFVSITLPFIWQVLDLPSFIRLFAVLLAVSFYASYSIREITKQHVLLKTQASIDPLTGLFNRSLLQSSLDHAISLNHRKSIPMSLLMLDIDHFKLINDQLGHGAGDESLQAIGHALSAYFRGSDRVFRLGGEEFLALLYDSNKQNSIEIAERLRKDIEKLSLIPDRKLTVSIGVSEFKSNMNWDSWMKRCDNNLYLAKSRGRNQVVA